jgi:hypothetical protein
MLHYLPFLGLDMPSADIIPPAMKSIQTESFYHIPHLLFEVNIISVDGAEIIWFPTQVKAEVMVYRWDSPMRIIKRRPRNIELLQGHRATNMSTDILSEPAVLETAKENLSPESESGYAVVDSQFNQSRWRSETITEELRRRVPDCDRSSRR